MMYTGFEAYTIFSRDKARNAARPALQKEVLDSGFTMKEDIKKLGYNDRILVVHSALLGDTAKDQFSFTGRLIRFIA